MRPEPTRPTETAILVYRIGQLGDTLVALPAIQAIAEKHPQARRVLLTDHHKATSYVSSWDVLKSTGWIDDVVFYEPRGLRRLEQMRQTLSLATRLRAYQFSTVYNLAMRTSKLATIRDRAFFRIVAGAQSYRAMDHVTYPPPSQMAGALPRLMPEWKRVLSAVAPDRMETGYRIPVPDVARLEFATKADELASADLKIALAPGSKMPAKCWPEDRFAALGQLLLARFPGIRLLVVGGREDQAVGDRLCAAWGNGENWAGRLSIYGTAALMERCSLFVGNDTGTMHLAAMVGLPCVGLFSARDYPGLWEPYGEGHAIFRKDISCAGCMLETCVDKGNACLKLISVEEVMNTTEALLRHTAIQRQDVTSPVLDVLDE